ncbi:ras and Rab interactor 2 isoform X2 [Amia ocellicauda]|uniref:ras and Rab interactor 2 isoform X2 n=1 Tax=Amia ocellicauda TaxID=2972642 RepID=UPI0034640C69
MMRGLEDSVEKISTERAAGGLENGSRGPGEGPLSLLDRLRLSRPAWCPGDPWDRERANTALRGCHTGCFLVLCNAPPSLSLFLCVSVGGDEEPVREFPIKHTDTVFHLVESHLGFSNLVQLVAFYTLSRDVLPCCLSLPPTLLSLSAEQTLTLSKLGPEFWLCSPPRPHVEPSHMTTPPLYPTNELSMCSIQVTSADGALCIINPLFLEEHGDDWLTQHSPPTTSPSLSPRATNHRRERRLSTTRAWGGAGLRNRRAPSLDKEQEDTPPTGEEGVFSVKSPVSPSPPPVVVLRRKSDMVKKEVIPTSPDLLTPVTPDPSLLGRTRDSSGGGGISDNNSPSPQFPHRVSWIEDGVWLPPSSLSAPSHHPHNHHHLSVYELDSLSISSTEEDPDNNPHLHGSAPHPSHHHTSQSRLSLALADKVRNRLSAVGHAIGGLVSAQQRLTNRGMELCERRGSCAAGGFGEQVRAFLDAMLHGGGGTHPSGSEMLQEVRGALTALREALLDSPEIQAVLDSLTDTNEADLDAMLEVTIHKIVLKPLRSHLYTCLREYRLRDGTLQRLNDNQEVMHGKSIKELGGSPGVGVPDAVTMERIQQRLTDMHKSYSPSKKVQHLLKICKTIYQAMSSGSGAVLGADDFLPCLTWVLLGSELSRLQLDTEYMMELLDPGQLQGEGGYYLTSLYAALFHISSFRPRLVTRQVSAEAQRSINQWHRRRTLHYSQSQGRRRVKARPTHRQRLDGEPGRAEGDQGKRRSLSPLTTTTEEEEEEDERGCVNKAKAATNGLGVLQELAEGAESLGRVVDETNKVMQVDEINEVGDGSSGKKEPQNYAQSQHDQPDQNRITNELPNEPASQPETGNEKNKDREQTGPPLTPQERTDLGVGLMSLDLTRSLMRECTPEMQPPTSEEEASGVLWAKLMN